MLKFYGKASETLRQLRSDKAGVVSFEYVIVAAAVITVVVAAFSATGTGSISDALTTGIGKITTAMTP